ncbi:hypothetical protein QEN19_000078 [Hanseniaspora menglaensis]
MSTEAGEIPFISLTKNDLMLLILSLFLSPLSVFLRTGFWSKDFLINVCLTLLLGIPGFIHAVWVIYTTSELRVGIPESSLEQGLATGPKHDEEEFLERNTRAEEQPLINTHFPHDNKIQI